MGKHILINIRRVLLLLLTVTLFSGCGKIKGPYNELFEIRLENGHTARINLNKKKGNINANIFLSREGRDLICSQYVGHVKFNRLEDEYVVPLGQYRLGPDLTKKETKYYTDDARILLYLKYNYKNQAYTVQISESKCPVLNMKTAIVVDSPKKVEKALAKQKKAEEKPTTTWGKTKEFIGTCCDFCVEHINGAFERVFGRVAFVSHWWILFYLGGLLIMLIGLEFFTPLVWIGIIMEYAYLLYMSPPFFILWPSIVGWGWFLLCLIPGCLLVAFNVVLCLGVLYKSFTSGFLTFLIMVIPAIIAIMSIFNILYIVIMDHLELVLLIIVGFGGSSKVFIGTFIDSHGNVWDVYAHR